jgi:hypothetical protein
MCFIFQTLDRAAQYFLALPQDGEEDSDAEADDLALVQEIEAKLLKHDKTFTTDDTIEAQRTRQTALISAFLRGSDKLDPDNIAQSYQLHLNVERIRVPEVWFQPAIAGVESAGIAEIAGWLLNGFPEEERRRMQQVGRGVGSNIDIILTICLHSAYTLPGVHPSFQASKTDCTRSSLPCYHSASPSRSSPRTPPIPASSLGKGWPPGHELLRLRRRQ